MSNEQKSYPTHRILFSQKKTNEQGESRLLTPTPVGAVWERKHGKQGGVVDWNLSPGMLGEGVYFLRENGQTAGANAPPKTYRLSFSEKQAGNAGSPKLGRPVEVAHVPENGEIHWSIEPERLNNGVYFLLENQRQQTQSEDKHAKAFAEVEAKKQGRSQALER